MKRTKENCIIHYDSTYAANMTSSYWTPNNNIELIARAQSEWTRVRRIGHVTEKHVKAHSGNTGNEYADRMAAKGAGAEENLPANIGKEDPTPPHAKWHYGDLMGKIKEAVTDHMPTLPPREKEETITKQTEELLKKWLQHSSIGTSRNTTD